ncbi:FtsX-like permease family protein [Streptomyces sp. NPDC049040]|uniref:FtsX-like permease family protein n=1 Tax=Streptomyces sp. NPDC049040 TaxID=3365593 RepID=UPI00371A06BA
MMLRLAIRTLRARRGGFLGAFLALFCAAALITACGGLLETGLRGRVVTERYAAAPVIVSADQNVHQTTVKHKKGKTKVKHKAKALAERVWLPADLAGKIARVDGVRAAVPELTFPAEAVAPGADGPPSYGHSWDSAPLTPFTLVAGHAPSASGDLVVDRGLAGRARLGVGDRVTVQATSAPRTYRVTGIAAARGGDLAHQTSLFFSRDEAERLAAHPGQAMAIAILAKPGATIDLRELRQVLPGSGTVISTGDGRGPVEFLDAAGARVQLVSMGGAIGGTSLLVAVLVVVGTFALSIQQRHRELALLRAIAATSGQIRRLIGREALLVGGAAGVLGSLAGLPLAHWLLGRFVAIGALPDTLRPTVGFLPMAAGTGATLLGAWAAARISARRIARIHPAQALAEAATERRTGRGRTVAGLILLAGGGALVAVLGTLDTEPAATPVTYLCVVVLAGAVSLLGPFVVAAGTALLAGPLRLGRFPGLMAGRNVRHNAVRMAAAVTPLALLVAMSSTVLFVRPTLDAAAQREAAAGTRAGWVLASDGLGVPGAAADAVRRVPGVTAVTEVVRSTVRVGLDKYPVQGVTSEGLSSTWDPDVVAGSLEHFGTDSVAVSRLVAGKRGLKPGSRLALTLGDGTPVTLTVAAVYGRGLGFGDLTLSHRLLARHVDNPLSSTVLVAAGGTAGRDRLSAAVRQFPGVRVLDRGGAEKSAAGRQQTDAEVGYLAMALVLAFTAIAVVNTLAMSTAERVGEFALLRLAGATRRQVLRMLRFEALAVLLIGAALGSGIALAVVTAFSVGMTGRAAPAVEPLAYACVVALAALLVLAATALPGRVALRTPPVRTAATAA